MDSTVFFGVVSLYSIHTPQGNPYFSWCTGIRVEIKIGLRQLGLFEGIAQLTKRMFGCGREGNERKMNGNLCLYFSSIIYKFSRTFRYRVRVVSIPFFSFSLRIFRINK